MSSTTRTSAEAVSAVNRITPFSSAEFQQRLDQVAARMAEANLDALIAYAVKNQPGAVVYLCGFEPRLGLHDVAYFVLAPAAQQAYTLVTNAFWEHPQNRPGPGETIISSDYANQIAARIPASARRVGIAGYRFFPLPVYLALHATYPQVEFVDATELVMRVAAVKSAAEIEVIRRCMQITDTGGWAFLEAARAGANERTIQAQVDATLVQAGAASLSYSTQVYSGEQVAICVGFGADRDLAPGMQVQLDCGIVLAGYRSDLSRVTSIGRPTPDVTALMETTADMYEAMVEMIAPGVKLADLAWRAINVAKAAGLDDYLYRSPNHSLGFVGHGIGCWYHEFPEIHPHAEGELQENMVVVPETILGRPGVGGAKIENAVLVTAAGGEQLSALPIRPWRLE
jgi:Xaa-Pro aminopeptidase